MTEVGLLDAPRCLPRLPLGRPVQKRLPSGTVDTHFHVFREGAPLAWPRSYTPQIATIKEWIEYSDFVGIAKGVLVQPSVYGSDNTVLLDALRAFPDRLRAVVVINPETSAEEIARLHSLGVRGVRLNTRNEGGLKEADSLRLAERIAPFGWVMQLQVHPEQLSDLVPQLSTWRLPLVVDHLGFAQFDAALPDAHLNLLQRLMDRANVHVKATAPYRLTETRHFGVFAAMVRRLALSHGERLLWGSDWPHTELWDAMPDDADLVELAVAAVEGTAKARNVFAANAEALFFGR